MENQTFIRQLCDLVGTESLSFGESILVQSLVPASWENRPLCAVQPTDVDKVAAIVRCAEDADVAIVTCGSGSRLATGHGPAIGRSYIIVQTLRLNRVLDHQPDDLTVTCEPGVTLAELQNALSHHKQFLPLDTSRPEQTTLGGIVSTNSAGFSRPAYGTPRDMLIGMRAVMTGGVGIKGGGKVVKNVAGYDVCKLFTGAWGTLGILTELTFKVRPMNESMGMLAWSMDTMSSAAEKGLVLCRSEIAPAFVLATNDIGRAFLVVGLHGAASRVSWQEEQLTQLVRQLRHESPPIHLNPEDSAHLVDVQSRIEAPGTLAARISCLPTELPTLVRRLESQPNIYMTAQSSVGVLNIRLMHADPAAVNSVREVLPKCANVVWTAIDPIVASEHNVAIWGETRQNFILHRALKTSLDPKSTFSPGRFLGGL